MSDPPSYLESNDNNQQQDQNKIDTSKLAIILNKLEKQSKRDLIFAKKLNVFDDELILVKDDIDMLKTVVSNHAQVVKDMSKIIDDLKKKIDNIETNKSDQYESNNNKDNNKNDDDDSISPIGIDT